MTHSSAQRLPFLDLEPPTDTFAEDVVSGLSATPKALPSKYFYDAHGSELFDAITELDEYYLTRSELAIMERDVEKMADRLGSQALLVEYGSGSSLKTRILLAHMHDPVGYVPIDISREHLLASAAQLQREFPHLDVLPVCADYTDEFDPPQPSRPADRIVVYFPGSTIGNFHPPEAVRFLQRAARLCGPRGGLLIGVDLKKDSDVLHAAYNDSRGVTAAFNKNVLRRMNRELGGNFRLNAFDHEAVYNEDAGRIEMYLVSLRNQEVEVAGHHYHFAEGERLSTEYSYKYSLEDFGQLAERAGFRVDTVWTDRREQFSVQYLVPGD